jgi:hypothetical protein
MQSWKQERYPAARFIRRPCVLPADRPFRCREHALCHTEGLKELRTDALDRFGTPLEQRFSKAEIDSMMRQAGLVDIRFSDREPFWVACGRRGSRR